MGAAAAPLTSGFPRPGVIDAARTLNDASGMTDIELTSIEGRHEQWIRFGRIAAERIVGHKTRIFSFHPGAAFAFVRWTSNDFGTIHSNIAIAVAASPDEEHSTLPFVRPGAQILLSIDGWQEVQRVLEAIGAVEAAGIDAADAAPDHWRHVANRIAAGLPFRPYGRDRHMAWLRRRAIEG